MMVETRSRAGRVNGTRTSSVILVVDDDSDVRELMAEFLEGAGFTVLSAMGGYEALRLLHERPDISLLLTDIRMPDMSGLELAGQAKAGNPALHVVLTSGYFLPQPVPYRFIRKPFRLFELESVVRAELGS
jgi:CheY-like chemotaxis protein